MSLRDELQAIHDQHGRLTPALVVETARPKNHPLHARVFDLAPREAAEAWYEHRAHELIRSVKITVTRADEQADIRMRAFLAVRADGPESYVYEPAEEVAADPFTRQLVLRDMEREWRQLLQRYEQFQEFLELVSDYTAERIAA